MHRINIIIFFVSLFVLQFFTASPAMAQVCWPQRVINQYQCSNTGTCVTWQAVCLGNSVAVNSTSQSGANNTCASQCASQPYAPQVCGPAFCQTWSQVGTCNARSGVVSCNTDPGVCQANATILNCLYQADGSCSETSEQLVYGCWGPGVPTVTPGGPTITPTSFVPPPTPLPPGCTCGGWVNGACGAAGGCSNGDRRQTRSCNPAGCGNTSQCIPDPSCLSNPTPTPTPFGCTCGGWSDGGCGPAAGCPYGEIRQTRSCNPAGCSHTVQCIPDPRCINVPTPTGFIPSPTPNICTAPTMQTPVLVSCAGSSGDGQINWRWNRVTGANEYELVIVNNSTLVAANGPTWRTAANYGCAAVGSTCSFTTSLPAGTYFAQVRARGTCTVGPSSTSDAMLINICPSTLTAVAKVVLASNTSCTAVNASSTYANPVNFNLAPAVAPGAQTQSGSSPVTWNNAAPGTYTLSTSGQSPDYVLISACWNRTGPAPLSGTGLSATVNTTETLNWQLGYTLGRAWARVVGGDATICTNVSSPIPASLGANRYFMTPSTGGSPGVVYYGNDYDFDGDVLQKGANYVSSTNRLAQESGTAACTNNWYQYLLNKYGLGAVAADMGGGSYTRATFPSRAQPYKVSGNMTTQGTWNLNSDGTNIVIFVEGDLTIGGEIRVPSRSFLAFVVQGDIIVDSSVGGNVGSSTPNVEGVYVTSGGFNTGVTNNNGSAKLIVNGIVIANSFSLQRDLDAQSANTTTPSEEFRYNPMYLLTLPNEFMDMQIKWEEVAP